MGLKKWLRNNFWLKVISLVLAVVTWLYISGELAKTQPSSFYEREATIKK